MRDALRLHSGSTHHGFRGWQAGHDPTRLLRPVDSRASRPALSPGLVPESLAHGNPLPLHAVRAVPLALQRLLAARAAETFRSHLVLPVCRRAHGAHASRIEAAEPGGACTWPSGPTAGRTLRARCPLSEPATPVAARDMVELGRWRVKKVLASKQRSRCEPKNTAPGYEPPRAMRVIAAACLPQGSRGNQA